MRVNRSWRSRVIGEHGAYARALAALCLMCLSCVSSVSAQNQEPSGIQAEIHVVSCSQGSGFAEYAMGLSLQGMQSVAQLTSPDNGITLMLDSGAGDTAVLDCNVGCKQTSGSAMCFPMTVKIPFQTPIAVQCASGPRAGQVWGVWIGLSAANCQTTVVGGSTTGWSCMIPQGNSLAEVLFDCDKGCSEADGCVCYGDDCSP